MVLKFRGVHTLTLDSKGRLAIPARYREALEEESNGMVILTISIDLHCLSLYPLPIWLPLENRLLKLPSLHKKTKRLQRLLLGHSTECQFDSQGRILVSSFLRQYANLEKNVALVGLGTKCEIWNEQAWNVNRNVWVEEENLETNEELPSEFSNLIF